MTSPTRDVLKPASEFAPPSGRRSVAKRGEREIFFRHWLSNPLGIGAVLPSGGSVARAMARELALDRPGAVLELGGGTGSLTRGLIAAGCPAERLVVIEREPALARHLQQGLPAVRVICGDAGDAASLLAEAGVDRLATVVSSLPIKWFPRAQQRAVLDASFGALGVGGAFVQLTNALASPIPAGDLSLIGEEVARIWLHFLPVQIWRYRRAETHQ
jgi:phosphatidylethanolamine/phosphatidyl-N-methylethanolamine N-methyltransferase